MASRIGNQHLPHRAVALAHAESLRGRDDVQAVLLAGSVARGEHLASSDVDLLVVGPESMDVRVEVGGLLVERIAHSEQAWASRFDRPKTSWLYAFCEAQVLLDDDGAAGRLQQLAATTRADYRTSSALRHDIAQRLWHSQAKLARARDGATREQGFWSAIIIEYTLNALYAVHDVPLPAGSRLAAHLGELPLSTVEQEQVDALLTGTTSQRLHAAIALTTDLLERLGPVVHRDTSPVVPPPSRGVEEGGEPACLLPLVCDECGQIHDH